MVAVEKVEFWRKPSFHEALLSDERDSQMNDEREYHDDGAEGDLLLAIAVKRKLYDGR